MSATDPLPGPCPSTPKHMLATAPKVAPHRKKNLFSSGLATAASTNVKKMLAASNELNKQTKQNKLLQVTAKYSQTRIK